MVIPEHSYTVREGTVCSILKEIDQGDIHTFINVGFHDWQDPRRHWWIKVCEQNNIDWSIVEVFEENVADAVRKGCPEDKIFNLDIRNVELLPPADLLMFWHGPEHIIKEEFLDILPLLEAKYKVLIFGMPLGEEPQGAAYGNLHERHVSAWSTEEWRELDYKVYEVRDRQQYPHITAFKIQQ